MTPLSRPTCAPHAPPMRNPCATCAHLGRRTLKAQLVARGHVCYSNKSKKNRGGVYLLLYLLLRMRSGAAQRLAPWTAGFASSTSTPSHRHGHTRLFWYAAISTLSKCSKLLRTWDRQFVANGRSLSTVQRVWENVS
eukprot:gene15230-biopygen2147